MKLFVILIITIEVGKSYLSFQGNKKGFEDSYSPTLGFEFFTFNIRFNKNDIIKLEVWDTSGNENYRPLIEGFYKDISLAIIVYAINE